MENLQVASDEAIQMIMEMFGMSTGTCINAWFCFAVQLCTGLAGRNMADLRTGSTLGFYLHRCQAWERCSKRMVVPQGFLELTVTSFLAEGLLQICEILNSARCFFKINVLRYLRVRSTPRSL